MSDHANLPESIRAILARQDGREPLDALAIHAILKASDESGRARVRDVAANYRDDYLRALRVKGVDAEREAGRLGQDDALSPAITQAWVLGLR